MDELINKLNTAVDTAYPSWEIPPAGNDNLDVWKKKRKEAAIAAANIYTTHKNEYTQKRLSNTKKLKDKLDTFMTKNLPGLDFQNSHLDELIISEINKKEDIVENQLIQQKLNYVTYKSEPYYQVNEDITEEVLYEEKRLIKRGETFRPPSEDKELNKKLGEKLFPKAFAIWLWVLYEVGNEVWENMKNGKKDNPTGPWQNEFKSALTSVANSYDDNSTFEMLVKSTEGGRRKKTKRKKRKKRKKKTKKKRKSKRKKSRKKSKRHR